MIRHHGSHRAGVGGHHALLGRPHRCEVLWHPMWLFVLTFLCMFEGVSAGVVDGQFRQRNIFPLPRISGGEQSGPHSGDWAWFANRGIQALNEISGCMNSQVSSKRSTRVQKRALSHIAKAYQEVWVAPEEEPGRSCLQELCSSSRLYFKDRNDVQPYSRDLVSWPEVESLPVPLEGCLPHADRERLAAWQDQMLKKDSGDQDVQEVCQPYSDPILKHNSAEYAGFLQELQKRNMISFQHTDRYPSMLGIFFVRKKSGKLRLIFDTRQLNQLFHEPPSTDLPSADAFTRLEIPDGEEFLLGSGDLANAFYTLSVPTSLARMFTLPQVKAGSIGVSSVDGASVRPEEFVTPYLTVLPMGWAWALHFCQGVMEHAIAVAGFGVSSIIGDKRPPVHLTSTEEVAVAGYVDNYCVIGCNRASVDAGLAKIASILREWGLSVHEEVAADFESEFVGLHFNGHSGVVSIKPSRIRKLQRAIHELLERNFATGHLVQLLLGHITWALMCRREGLSLVNTGYAFVHKHYDVPTRLWPRLRTELSRIADLLPLFRVQINSGWSEDVTASDSSPYGYGICHRSLQGSIARAIGCQSERWRFRCEDAVDARAHAAKTAGVTDLKSWASSLSHADLTHVVEELSQGDQFHEVPRDILHQNDWSVAWSRPWKHEDNILHTEALALVWSFEHSLRANRNFGKRLLLLCDNMPLTLSVTKGRGKSSYLIRPLQKICALSLATGARAHVRWVPSEWNIADRPSRALSQWAAQGLRRWFASECGSGESPCSYGKGRSCPGDGKTFEKAEGSSRIIQHPRGSDLFGGTECPTTHVERLSSTIPGVSTMVPNPPTRGDFNITTGCGVGRVSPGVVRSRPWNQRRCPSSSSSQVFLTKHCQSPRSSITSSGSKGIEGLEPDCSSIATDAPTFGSNGGDGRGVAMSSQTEHGPEVVLPIRNLPSSWRMQSDQRKAIDPPPKEQQQLFWTVGGASQPMRRSNPRKNQHFRCIRDSGLRHLDGRIFGQEKIKHREQRQHLVRQSQGISGNVQHDHHCLEDRPSGVNLVCSPTWGGHTRRHFKTTYAARGETAWPLGQRQQPQALCEGGQTSVRACKGASSGSGVWHKHPEPATKIDFKTPHDSKASVWNPTITKRMRERSTVNSAGLPSLSGADLLKAQFRKVMSKFNGSCRRVFLDIFSGVGGVHTYLTKKGYPVIAIDICIDSRFDVCNRGVRLVLEGWIKSGCILGVWLGTPCTTWSRARHGPVGSSWGPIRSNDFIYGIPGVSFHDQQKLKVGNQTMRFTARIISLCIKFFVPCILENPIHSLLWFAPPVSRCAVSGVCRSFVCDFCQYGAKWRKRTKLLTWHCQEFPSLQHTCAGRGGKCSASHKYHIILKGQDPVTKQLWTHLAQPYPWRFAVEGAKLLVESADHMHNFKLRKYFGN